jgi:hypothetical protein
MTAPHSNDLRLRVAYLSIGYTTETEAHTQTYAGQLGFSGSINMNSMLPIRTP